MLQSTYIIPWQKHFAQFSRKKIPLDHIPIWLSGCTGKAVQTAAKVQQRRLTAVCCSCSHVHVYCWCVVWGSNVWRFLIFLYKWRGGGANYVLDLRTFVVDKLSDDDNLVPKHVGAGTWYEVSFAVCFIVFQLLHLKNTDCKTMHQCTL
jgi:hypothetical protein